MKAILLSLALTIGLGAFAQKADTNEKSPADKAQQRTEQMVKDLGLDAAQKEKVATINLTYSTAIKNVNSLTDETAREKRGDVVKANRDNAFKEVLTPEQFSKMISLRAVKKAKHEADKKDKKAKSND